MGACVKMECSACRNSNMERGITLVYPCSKLGSSFGETTKYTISLTPDDWLMDPHNVNDVWGEPSVADFVTVLHRVTSLSIVGDFTPGYESVSLDQVTITAGKTAAVPMS